jgi:predicted TIM-barrel fold metal-dependent hydrolase
MKEIAKRPNVVVKVSGIMAAAKPGEWTLDQVRPVIEQTVEAFGIERSMFASDWPVCTLAVTLREWVDVVHEVTSGWSAEDRMRLLGENARKFYQV